MSELAAVLREVAARVARIRTVREDDGLDALRDAAAGRGRFARVEEAGHAGNPLEDLSSLGVARVSSVP